MKMITLPKLRDALRDLQARGQGRPGDRRARAGADRADGRDHAATVGLWRRSRLDHIDLVVSDLRAQPRLLPRPARGRSAGRSEGEIEGERGERVVYLGRRVAQPADRGASLRERQSDAQPTLRTIGTRSASTTSPFRAPSREAVDDRADWARNEGVILESEPQEYAYSPGYYAVFFPDPDGIKLEIVHKPAFDSFDRGPVDGVAARARRAAALLGLLLVLAVVALGHHRTIAWAGWSRRREWPLAGSASSSPCGW